MLGFSSELVMMIKLRVPSPIVGSINNKGICRGRRLFLADIYMLFKSFLQKTKIGIMSEFVFSLLTRVVSVLFLLCNIIHYFFFFLNIDGVEVTSAMPGCNQHRFQFKIQTTIVSSLIWMGCTNNKYN